jgi:hydrogenase expression/formation protein HypD
MEDKDLVERHVKEIKEVASGLGDVTIMEICGGHTNVIMKYGVREALPSNIKLISGPGCPVCVSSQRDIDLIIELASNGIPVATYGDMMRVPGTKESLEEARAKGGKVFEVYSTTEVLEIRKAHPDVVFFGVGFETTAPMTGFLLKNRVPVLSVHKLVPPALVALTSGDLHIDGFIDPGHVATITGTEGYRKIKVPQVIAGFTIERILRGISVLLEMIRDGNDGIVNGYPEVVKIEGNMKAQGLLNDYFKVTDSEWRGLGVIPGSGLEVRDDSLNARLIYKDILDKVPVPPKTGCRCGEVLKGQIDPPECPLYRNVCSPEEPQGACMVSAEGSCAISYRYGK